MDIDFLRTFLEVNRTRHFAKAAKDLFVSQSTISARIRMLEESIGVKVFTRDRNDIRLTEAGERLLPQAEQIVNQWDETKREIQSAKWGLQSLNVGSVSSLWDILLQDWLAKLKLEISGLQFKGESLGSDSQTRGLLARTLDVGLMFEPPKVMDLEAKSVCKIDLVLVSSNAGLEIAQALEGDYVFVDWGTTFLTEHSRAFPDLHPANLQLDLGRWAVDHLLNTGGSAYLAKTLAESHLNAGDLHLVEGAPSFQREAYAVFNRRSKNLDLVESALELLLDKF
ncbi:MAG: LysR family transcriptional regulator [SAR324 cluster bacterium]|nr:LysR family transcriptional regulator [SAR324 cluster bacterium]